MLTISAKTFNQLTPSQQLAALRATTTKRKPRTAQATYERLVQAEQRRQQQRDAMIAATLTFCPNFLDGAPLNAAA